MDAKLQRRIQRYGWDKAAGYYEQSWQNQLEPAQSRFLEMADPKLGERVLEIACGTGLVTFRVAEKIGVEGEIVGTDISEEMINAALVQTEQLGITNARFIRMDAENLTFPEASFDVALCSLGLMYVPDPLLALEGMCRVLEPNGRVCVLVWGRRSQCGWAEIFPIVNARVKSEVCPMFFQLGGEGVLETILKQARFAKVQVERFSYELNYATPDDACEAAFAGGPVAMAYFRFDEQTRSETHKEYLASIEPHRSGNGYAIPGEFVIAYGQE